MQLRKNIQANIEGNRFLFFEIGLAVALLVVWVLLELQTQKPTDDQELMSGVEVEVVLLPQFTTETIEAPPPRPERFTYVFDKTGLSADDETARLKEKTGETEYPIIPEIPDRRDSVDVSGYENHLYIPATFEGGQAAIMKYLKKHLRYPPQAISQGIQGKVFIKLTLSKNGKVKNASAIKGVHHLLDKEAIRVTQQMPDWIPARKLGQNVESQVVIPVTFVLKH